MEGWMLHVVMVIRDFFMQLNPAVYYITDHYRNAPYVLVRLSAAWQPMGGRDLYLARTI
ncbi:hypothetical protein [Paenibacillus campinasensis]|uniref:hypothetical protein n=1 Tax=Paenibacillus campinasensis TaxID=66347 RepID=UPI001C52D53B|nr:hypothetical protein [Paenibacillus campinasensis]